MSLDMLELEEEIRNGSKKCINADVALILINKIKYLESELEWNQKLVKWWKEIAEYASNNFRDFLKSIPEPKFPLR